MARTKLRDSILASIVVGATLVAAMHFDAFEGFAVPAQRYDQWQADELIFLPVLLALASIFFRWREHGELQREAAERKQAEEKLREANRRLEELASLKADFTAMVAHELGTPLAAIRGYADMVAMDELEPDERYRALGRGRNRSGRRVIGAELGFYLSRLILRAHGSELMFHPASGGGSVFFFELDVTA